MYVYRSYRKKLRSMVQSTELIQAIQTARPSAWSRSGEQKDRLPTTYFFLNACLKCLLPTDNIYLHGQSHLKHLYDGNLYIDKVPLWGKRRSDSTSAAQKSFGRKKCQENQKFHIQFYSIFMYL
jgi:hypothetical protein